MSDMVKGCPKKSWGCYKTAAPVIGDVLYTFFDHSFCERHFVSPVRDELSYTYNVVCPQRPVKSSGKLF
jgi:hypothetical protein